MLDKKNLDHITVSFFWLKFIPAGLGGALFAICRKKKYLVCKRPPTDLSTSKNIGHLLTIHNPLHAMAQVKLAQPSYSRGGCV